MVPINSCLTTRRLCAKRICRELKGHISHTTQSTHWRKTIHCKEYVLLCRHLWVRPFQRDIAKRQGQQRWGLDSSLSDLVERILPLGTYYTAISAFIENRSHLECGLVNHALAAAIREMLRVSGACSGLSGSSYW